MAEPWAPPTRSWTFDEFMEAVDGMPSVALRAVATLRVADHIAGGSGDVADLAERTGTAVEPLRRLMRYLACRGVFAVVGPDRFGLTQLSMLLIDRHATRLRAWLDAGGIGVRLDRAVAALPESLRTGRPGYEHAFDVDFYTDMANAGAPGATFDELRGTHASEYADELVAGGDWAGTGTVVDVGGGAGVVAERLLRHFPHLRCHLVDRPEPVEAAVRRSAGSPWADRLIPAPGSFFAPLPAGADAYLLSNVLHNWADEPARRILRRCADAMPAGGRVVIVERVLDDTDPWAATAMDLRMFLLCGGRERSVAEFADLAEGAGLQLTGDHLVPCGLHLLTLTHHSDG